ncbi:hypothetical protein C8N46_103229 [Kordia periserrulae]|uniref:Uncharacterized protein n=1 Tax=Kordia periserrulae TaxID=701523 RepID=A0A2T6C1E1_9FLAO|nr:hypothetical protein [Kordia periserrulae]PTX62131.1 hypothetical protein C8N46_103229 [Kordia periserrulae]
MQAKTTTSIRLPQSITLQIETKTPASNNMTRKLIFENYEGRRIELPITLMRTASHQLEVTDFPDTTHNLQILGSLNHRSFWDKIYIKNTGGNSSIDIYRMTLIVHYHKVVAGAEKDIPMLSNTIVNRVLGSGDSEVYLTPFIERQMLRHAGLTSRNHPAAVLAAKDLGKSGTSAESYDQYGKNPKYRGWISYECSEFASWYLHETECWRDFTNKPKTVFRDITATSQLHAVYKSKKRTYYYHNGRNRFLNEETEVAYTPKPGDIFMRRGNGKFEHSMIFLRWNARNKTALVIDGPYPVTLRTVEVHALETRADDPKDFIVCESVMTRF